MRKFTAQNKRETDSSLNSLGKGYAFYMFKITQCFRYLKIPEFYKNILDQTNIENKTTVLSIFKMYVFTRWTLIFKITNSD